jgi:hypothetical protein
MTKARDLANGGFGLVLVKPSTVVNGTDNGKGTVSFSAATSVSLNGIFNSTYENYRIVLNITTTSADTTATMKLRVANSDDSTTSYSYARNIVNRAGSAGAEAASDVSTGWVIGQADSANQKHWMGTTIDMLMPFLTQVTAFNQVGTFLSTAAVFFGTAGGGIHFADTSYDGFSIISSSGTITGTVSVYGYNK